MHDNIRSLSTVYYEEPVVCTPEYVTEVVANHLGVVFSVNPRVDGANAEGHDALSVIPLPAASRKEVEGLFRAAKSGVAL